MGAFSINDKDACLVAASYRGYNTHLDDLETYRGKAHLSQGCYVKRKGFLFVPVEASCEHDSCNGNVLKRPNSWEPICSSGAYPRWMSSNGYMDSSAIATSVAENEQYPAETFRACPAPKTQCTNLLLVSINDFVRLGFGASIGGFGPLRTYIAAIGCKFAVGRSFASHWNSTGFAPFWNEELPDTEFHARWTNGDTCGGLHEMNRYRLHAKCEMPPGFISASKYRAFQRSPHCYVFFLLATCTCRCLVQESLVTACPIITRMQHFMCTKGIR